MAGSRPRFDVASRSGGKSAVAMAAYRAGERLECETYGQTSDYTRKAGVLHSEIMAPDHAPDWVYDRGQLWNAVERIERNKDGSLKVAARLARDIVLPLAHELDLATNLAAVRELIAEQFVARGMIADFSIHAPGRDGDERNFHAHIMLTMREITPEGFSSKKATETARSWNHVSLLEGSIDRWQEIQNRELERGGHEARCNFSSFASRGIDREAEQHEGPHATAMKRKGQDTRIGQENADRQERNSARAWEHVAALKELAQIAAERARFNEWMNERTDHLRAAQTESLRELDDHHERRARDLSDELDAFYGPHLRTVEAEAGKIRQRLEAKGVLASLRRVWSGREDRRKLDDLEATITDTRQRVDEAKGLLFVRQQAERFRLKELQQTRAAQQREGLETAQQRKEQALKSRENAARAVWEKATDPERAAAQAERERRLAWYERKKAPTQEAAAIEDGPPKAKVSAREEIDRELYNRAKGIDTTRNNSRLHVNRDVIERVERADHNARYDQNMKAKAEAEAPAKAAELARLREIAANRMDELNRQETPAQQPEQPQRQSLKDRARAAMQEPQQAPERGQLAQHHAAAQEPPAPALSLRERAAAATTQEAARSSEQQAAPQPSNDRSNER